MINEMCSWQCPVCGRELKIGPAMVNFASYCSDPKCSYNKDLFATADSTTDYSYSKNVFATADSATDYENTKEEKHET